MTREQLLKLRNRKDLILYDRIDKMFVGFKLNTSDNRICWKRFVSKDRRNWVCWNEYLSLKDVDNIINTIKNKIELTQFSIVIH